MTNAPDAPALFLRKAKRRQKAVKKKGIGIASRTRKRRIEFIVAGGATIASASG
jgi:hypothetical protein